MKVSIVGIGKVGATLAYTLLGKGHVSEIALVNRTVEIAQGEELDLRQAASFSPYPCRWSSGGVEVSAGSDLVVLCLSAPWQPHYRRREELARDNAPLLRKWVPELLAASPDACFLVITNPVDAMTALTLRLTGLPPHRVFGLGTLIDSARFRELLSRHLLIHPDDVRAYILGEHGDRQFPLFSMASAGGRRLEGTPAEWACFEAARNAGYEVARRKGYTNYAVSMAAELVVEAMAHDAQRTLPLSVSVGTYDGVDGVCLSLPVVMGRHGILRVIEPEFTPTEREAFDRAAKAVADVMRELGL